MSHRNACRAVERHTHQVERGIGPAILQRAPQQHELAGVARGKGLQRGATAAAEECLRCRGTLRREQARKRPLRAGDYSFNNLGITGYLMLSSTMPDDLRAEKGYYPVGGCGGNIAWHTEDDTLEIGDKDNLYRDVKVYAAAVLRVVNASVPPFDFRASEKAKPGWAATGLPMTP